MYRFVPTPDLSLASTIPSAWYTDPGFLEREKEHIFYRTWQPVGNASLVERPKDYFSTSILDEPIVVARDKDGTLRAFYNVCRHRAHTVVSGKGNRATLQCGYHGWTYTLDGKLFAAPEMEQVEEWSVETTCLAPVRVEEWGPFIFANLDNDAPSLLETLGNIPKEISDMGFDISKMQSYQRRDYDINCNWKVYVDNYLEGYHIPIAHPGLFSEIDYENYMVETFRHHSSQIAPVLPDEKTKMPGRDRRIARTSDESKALYYWVFPNWMLNVYPDNLSINIIQPIDHKRTLTIFEWYFSTPGTGEGWESMNQMIAFSDEIQQEDIRICEAVQKGLGSRSYDRGRFSVKRENGVHHFQTLLHEFLTKE